MKLIIDRKWKWLAMAKDGDWFLYRHRPRLIGGLYWNWDFLDRICYAPFNLPKARNWKQSLHKRVGDEWVKVVA